MKTTIKLMLMFLVLGVLMSGSVFAAVVGGNVTTGVAQTGENSNSTNISIDAGEVQEVNISGESITGKWAGFYGNIAGGIALTDGTDNFYNWTVTDVSGSVVYAANQSVANWGVITAADYTDMPAHLLTAAVDNYTNTFTQDAGTFTLPDASTVTSVDFVTTNGVAAINTYALKVDGALVWGAEAVQNGAAFNGELVDYQLLVPAESGTVYHFYMELP